MITATSARRALSTTVLLLATTLSLPTHAATVYMAHGGPLDVSNWSCQEVTRSNVIRKTCYDPQSANMLVRLNSSWYRYCDVPQRTLASLHESPSMGRYFTTEIRGQYTC